MQSRTGVNSVAAVLLLISVTTCKNLSHHVKPELEDSADAGLDELHTNHLTEGNVSSKQAPSCRYDFSFQSIGQTANLDSPNYPNSYPANTNCQYFISSPAGSRIQMTCNDFNVEQAPNCQYDIFYYSLSGSSTFSDQAYTCGMGSFTRTSSTNKISIGFRSDDSNPSSNAAFRFRCQLTAVAGGPAPQPGCSCGLKNEMTRIVGGTQSSIGAWPWRCALYTQNNGVFCGCTIISKNYLMTAAHCTNAVKGQNLYVDVGDYDISSTQDTNNQVILADQIVQHPQYSTINQDSDISILHLATPLTFSKTVQPVCLPWKFRSWDFSGSSVTASGWGTTQFGGAPSNVLREVDLPVLTTSQCQRYYTTVNNNMFCTYNPGKDTCQGDSGGSIEYQDDNTSRYYAVGIVSWGNGCADVNQPGVYTKVTNYLDWIQANSPGEVYCQV